MLAFIVSPMLRCLPTLGLILALGGCGADNLAEMQTTAAQKPENRLHEVRKLDPASVASLEPRRYNDVLVLGTHHLSNFPDEFDPTTLAPVFARLENWAPDMIAIENRSGPQCAYMRDYPVRYTLSVEYYCWDPKPVREATGLSVPEAVAKSEAMLADWPSEPTPEQRRELAATFLAAGERASALVQWLRLPGEERVAGYGLDESLVNILDDYSKKRSEVVLIAAPLAAALGHEYLVHMDDQTAGRPSPDREAAGKAIEAAWESSDVGKRRRKLDDALMEDIATEDGVLALYRADNSPDQFELVYGSDFGAALHEPSEGQYGRGYVGYWETRNLRMAANIREALMIRPGSRMLVIVGASHKPYLDDYLDRMHDVRVADATDLLR